MFEGEINGAIFWDIENCQVPTGVSSGDIAENIRRAVNHHHHSRGAIKLFSAYADFAVLPRKLRESYRSTGVKLVDVPNGRKDAADKAILVDMLSFAMDNRPPSFIVLISGDVDFSYVLHTFRQRGYTVMVVVRSGGVVSPALINAGHYVLDWYTVALGGGFVFPKSCPMSCGDANRPDILNKGEMAVSKANVQRKNPSSLVVEDVYCNNSSSLPSELYETPESLVENASNSYVAANCFTKPMSAKKRNDAAWHMRPRSLIDLKRKIKWLTESLGGSLPLVLLRSEYHRKFGHPLYPHDFGFVNVEKLIDKMTDTFFLEGMGDKKRLYVHSSPNTCEGSIPIAKNKNNDTAHGKEMGINRSSNLSSSSFDKLSAQVKNKDPQLYASSAEKNSEEPKLDALLKEARIEDSISGTNMSQGDIGTLIEGQAGYEPEQRVVTLVHPSVDSGLHPEVFESVQDRVVIKSAVEREGQCSRAVVPSSVEWKRGPPMSSFSRPAQNMRYTDDCMMRGSVQKISTSPRPRSRFCRGRHVREDFPIGKPVCFCCGQSGHMRRDCPHLFRDGSKQ